MAFIRNLEERFRETMDDLYSEQPKDSAALHPIMVTKPNDPNKNEGTGGSGRMAPVQRVLEDQERMTRWLTSSTGLLWLAGQAVLQTGNAISETRLLNPLFINLNLSPNVHIKRQLFDQTDIIVLDPNRSPGSTPEVGLAGRLQKQTGADATYRVMGSSTARSTLGSVLGATALAQTVSGIFQFNEGTNLIDERPELDIEGKYYSSILYAGRIPMINRGMEFLVDALGAVGLAAGVIGLPQIFTNLRGKPPLPRTANFSLSGPDPLGTMPYFNPLAPGIPEDTDRYLVLTPAERLIPLLPKIFGAAPAASQISGITLGTAINNLLGGLGFGSFGKFSSIDTFKPTVSIGPDPATIQASSAWATGQTTEIDLLSKTERTMRQRYEAPDDEGTVLSNRSKQRIIDIKQHLADYREAWQGSYESDDYRSVLYRRGIEGGITLENAERFSDATSQLEFNEVVSSLPGTTVDGKKVIRYYHDRLNLITDLSGREKLNERENAPVDYITVSFYDTQNNRLIPFRAHISSLTETISPDFQADRYLGRIERNIVYQGVSRQLAFKLYLHAFSPEELHPIWQKINTLTGLTYPASISSDGYLIPPITELTVGNIYYDQPGWISNLQHSIADDVSWEIEKGSQLPHTVEVDVTFETIEKKAMKLGSEFYGIGNQSTGEFV